MNNLFCKTKAQKFLLIIFLFFIGCTNSKPPEFQNGDLIFQTSLSSQSEALQLATGSRYSHMGIIYKNNGGYYVFEAIQPVQLTDLNKWIKRGKGGHFVVKRLKKSESLLTPEALRTMKRIGEKYAGKNYDLYFEWSDDRIYCSELVWKIYKQALNIEIGKLKKIKDFDLTHPVVKARIKERYGNRLPENEPVISPGQMFNSNLLYTVYSN